jgi:Predicted dehydrogenases and related proteins
MFKFGIMGAGKIARQFCDAVSRIEGASVVAIASKSEERAKRFAQDNGLASYYGDYEEMLKNEEIDAVYIATTMNYHYENLKTCFKWNKHVLCEKCMVLTYEEAQEIFSVAKQKQLFVMECMWPLFLPKSQKVRQWIDAGKIGNVKLAQATLGYPVPRDLNSRYFNPALGGGVRFDMAVYPIEMFGYFFNKDVTNIQSMIALAETGVDETINLSLQYDQCFANMQCSFAAKVPEDAYIYGDRGFIYIKKIHMGNSASLYDINGDLIEEFHSDDANGFTYQIIHAISCIESGKCESDIATQKMTLDCCKVFDYCARQIH